MKYDVWTSDKDGHAKLEHAGISATEVENYMGFAIRSIDARIQKHGRYLGVSMKGEEVAVVFEDAPRPIPEKI